VETGQHGGVNILGEVGTVNGDIIGRDKISLGPTAEELAQAEARKLVLDMISNTYRRAFSMNFQTRFTKKDDFERVLKSIQNCRSFIQSNFVRVQALSSQDAPFVHDALEQAEFMEASFERMKGIDGRLDGGGPEELTARFIAMEESRIKFLISVTKLAERYNIKLAPPPNSGGVPLGVEIAINSEFPYPGAEKAEVSSLSLQHYLDVFLVERGHQTAPTIVSHLIGQVRDPVPIVRKAAVRALGDIRWNCRSEAMQNEIQIALGTALHDQDARVRSSAVIGLCKGFGKNDAVVPDLIEALNDIEPDVRRSAIIALGKSAESVPSCLADFADALHDDNPHVRYSAAKALGKMEKNAKFAVKPLIGSMSVTYCPF